MSSFQHRWLAAGVIIAIIGAATPIGAQPGGTTEQVARRARARQYVDVAQRAEAAGDYETAILQYTAAYALIPHPILLYDLGQVSRLAGRHADAIAYYERFLSTGPSGDEAAVAEEWIEVYRRELAEERRVPQATDDPHTSPATRDPAPAVLPAPVSASAGQSAPAAAAPVPGASVLLGESAGLSARRKAALGVGAATAVSLAAALAFEWSGRRAYDDYLAGPIDAGDEGRYEAANRKHHIAQGLAITGVVGGVVTAYLWLTGPPADRSQRTTVLVARGLAGITVTETF